MMEVELDQPLCDAESDHFGFTNEFGVTRHIRYLKNSSLKKPMEAVEIKTSILGRNGMIIGAVALVLEHLFRTSEQKSMHSNTS